MLRESGHQDRNALAGSYVHKIPSQNRSSNQSHCWQNRAPHFSLGTILRRVHIPSTSRSEESTASESKFPVRAVDTPSRRDPHFHKLCPSLKKNKGPDNLRARRKRK